MRPAVYLFGLDGKGFTSVKTEVAERLARLGEIYARTADIPGVEQIRAEGIEVHSFDHLYQQGERFEEVYRKIAEHLISKAKEKGEVLYLVPGHPRVAEESLRRLEEMGERSGVEVVILGGRSFLDPLFTSMGFDPVEGFLLLDAFRLQREMLNPRLHTAIMQLTAENASDVKLTLMERYPDEYPLFLLSRLGSNRERRHALPLYSIDQARDWEWDNYTLLYLPPMKEEEGTYRLFDTARRIIEKLRSPEGCPWDRKQTHKSLKPYLIEETYEVIDAIDRGDVFALEEELGDLLLQILLHSRIAEEEGAFHVENVIEGLSRKMIRRHPHVFGEKKANDVNEAWANWKEMKEEEKKERGEAGEERSILDAVKAGLPPFQAALSLQRKAAEIGFDWESPKQVLQKVKEELHELKEASSTPSQLEELGDLIFAIVNLARFYRIDPEEALLTANQKFRRRFSYIEEKLRERGTRIEDAGLEEMERLWQVAKNEKKDE